MRHESRLFSRERFSGATGREGAHSNRLHSCLLTIAPYTDCWWLRVDQLLDSNDPNFMAMRCFHDPLRAGSRVEFIALAGLLALAFSSCTYEDKSAAPAENGVAVATLRHVDPSANWTIVTKTSFRASAADENAAAPMAPPAAKPVISVAEVSRKKSSEPNLVVDSATCRPWPGIYNPTDQMKAQALIDAYPEQKLRYNGSELISELGWKIRFSDGRTNKSTDELVNNPDVKDMFTWRYDFCGTGLPVQRGADAGRVRNEEFFTRMYGPCDKKPGEACGNVACRSKGAIVSVPWVPGMNGGTMQATTVNSVDKALRAVSDELDKLGPDYKKYLSPNGGSYVPRCIAGTHRLSVHSFGIAFDISPAYGQYWQYGLEKGITEARFETQNKPLVYKNKIPIQIVEIFEKHGFIWGGSWYHFDGMHFEYRPEFLALRNLVEKQISSAGRG